MAVVDDEVIEGGSCLITLSIKKKYNCNLLGLRNSDIGHLLTQGDSYKNYKYASNIGIALLYSSLHGICKFC